MRIALSEDGREPHWNTRDAPIGADRCHLDGVFLSARSMARDVPVAHRGHACEHLVGAFPIERAVIGDCAAMEGARTSPA
jgi:hypothetical protein